MSNFKCNLVIPGFGKSGTSSLHAFLDAHPSICMSAPKEPHFFSIDSRWSQGPDFHNKLFNHANGCEMIFGEASTTYSVSELAIERIENSLLHPRIILLLREPTERAISHYRWLFALGLETRPFRKAILQNGYDFDPNIDIQGNYMSYLEFSSYSKWVPKWKKAFGAKRVMLVKSNKLKMEPELVLRNCFQFLEIDQRELDLPEEQNRTVDVRAPIGRPIKKWIISYTPRSVKSLIRGHVPMIHKYFNKALTKKISVPPVSKKDQDWLQDLLREDVRFFENTTCGLNILNE